MTSPRVSSPIPTPGTNDLNDHAYKAIRANRTQSVESSSFDDDTGSREGESENGDVEMRDVESNLQQPMTKAGRLRLKQLERFKRILQERSKRLHHPTTSRWSAKTRGYGGGTDAPGEFDNIFQQETGTGGCREVCDDSLNIKNSYSFIQ